MKTICIIVVIFVSCGPGLYPVPKDPIKDPSLLIGRMMSWQEKVKTLNVMGRVESYSNEGVFKGRVTIIANAPSSLRVDGWSPSGDLVSALSANKDSFLFFSRGEKDCYTGLTCKENIELFLPLHLGLEDVIYALFGFPPVRDGNWEMDFDRRVGAYRLWSNRENRVQTLWIREDGVPIAFSIKEKGEELYRMELRDIRFVSDLYIPHLLRFISKGEDISIKYKEIEVNQHIDVTDFVLECPKGMGLKMLPCEVER